LYSISIEDLEKNYDRVATISNHFLQDIIARFSQYYSRQGQPDYDFDLMLEKILPE
jgi:hypothetical protein